MQTTLSAVRRHEERLLALLLLVDRYRRSDTSGKQTVFDAHLANSGYVNNWDLVDASAPYIVGAHLDRSETALLDRLAESPTVWERRIAILATFHGIKQRAFRPTLRIAERLLGDLHDLIHKAVGRMLREIGNRDQATEAAFLRKHCRTMPRTVLRYAIEKFPEPLRRRYLDGSAAPAKRRSVRLTARPDRRGCDGGGESRRGARRDLVPRTAPRCRA